MFINTAYELVNLNHDTHVSVFNFSLHIFAKQQTEKKGESERNIEARYVKMINVNNRKFDTYSNVGTYAQNKQHFNYFLTALLRQRYLLNNNS